MDTPKVSVCALLILLGVIGAYGIRDERSTSASSSSSSSSGSGSWGSSGVPYFGPGSDFQNNINQHFKSVQEQNEAISSRIQEQIRAQQQAFADSSNGLFGGGYNYGNGGRQSDNNYPNRYGGVGDGGWGSNHGSGENSYGSNSGSGEGGYGSRRPSGGGSYSASGSSGTGSGPHSAHSSISVGPEGGYQAGEISPASPGIFSRFGEEVDAPSGGNIAVFSSSSSSHSIGPDGKETSHKSATTGVNDNGKITIRTVHDP